MKKNVIIISLVLMILIIICIVGIKINSKIAKVQMKQNIQYEKYLENEIYGTDVASIINRAISDNEENNISKDEKGLYITNNQSSILIDLVMITDPEKEETTTYKMEVISKVGIAEFIKNFNTEKFKCTKREYHEQTGRIAYIELTQQY